jgi:hypothetical protein
VRSWPTQNGQNRRFSSLNASTPLGLDFLALQEEYPMTDNSPKFCVTFLANCFCKTLDVGLSEIKGRDGDHGSTPFYYALKMKRKDMMELLRQHGGHE